MVAFSDSILMGIVEVRNFLWSASGGILPRSS